MHGGATRYYSYTFQHVTNPQEVLQGTYVTLVVCVRMCVCA